MVGTGKEVQAFIGSLTSRGIMIELREKRRGYFPPEIPPGKDDGNEKLPPAFDPARPDQSGWKGTLSWLQN